MKRAMILVAALAFAGAVSAQQYPSRTVRVVVPWPPGQATDLAARLVAERLSQALGQPFVADNRPGAGGQIGTDAVVKAAPDGYTLLAASSGPISIMPVLQKTPYEPLRDLAPVSLIARVPFALVVNPSFPAANAKEFIALVRANPDKYTFSSSGTGATAHLFAELFNSMAQLKARHVPYKGTVPALTDIMNGQIAYDDRDGGRDRDAHQGGPAQDVRRFDQGAHCGVARACRRSRKPRTCPTTTRRPGSAMPRRRGRRARSSPASPARSGRRSTPGRGQGALRLPRAWTSCRARRTRWRRSCAASRTATPRSSGSANIKIEQ